MKKTIAILTVMAMVGAAHAYTVSSFASVGLGTQAGLQTGFNFEAEAAGANANKSEGDLGGWSYKPLVVLRADEDTTATNTKYGQVKSSDQTNMYKTGMQGNFSTHEFTVSLDVNMLDANYGAPIFNIKQGTGTGSDAISLIRDDDGYVALSVKGAITLTTAVKISDMNTDLDWMTFTLTGTNGTGDNQLLTLYINGEQVGTSEGWANDSSLCALQLGSTVGGGSATVTQMNIDNFGIWNKALTSSQVAMLPEPATATLSLLALAGLAARRRRK